jgi:hypothetical protein
LPSGGSNKIECDFNEISIRIEASILDNTLLIGEPVEFKQDFVVRDIYDKSLPALFIKKGSKGTIVGKDEYDGRPAWEIKTDSGNIVFVYTLHPDYVEVLEQ